MRRQAARDGTGMKRAADGSSGEVDVSNSRSRDGSRETTAARAAAGGSRWLGRLAGPGRHCSGSAPPTPAPRSGRGVELLLNQHLVYPCMLKRARRSPAATSASISPIATRALSGSWAASLRHHSTRPDGRRSPPPAGPGAGARSRSPGPGLPAPPPPALELRRVGEVEAVEEGADVFRGRTSSCPALMAAVNVARSLVKKSGLSRRSRVPRNTSSAPISWRRAYRAWLSPFAPAPRRSPTRASPAAGPASGPGRPIPPAGRAGRGAAAATRPR